MRPRLLLVPLVLLVVGSRDAAAICPAWHQASALLAPHAALFDDPTDSTCLRIQACVNFDVAGVSYFDTVLIEGRLRFADGQSRTMSARRLYVLGPDDDVSDPAALVIGTATSPHQAIARIALADRGVSDCATEVVIDPSGNVTSGALPADDPYHPDAADADAVAKLPTRTMYVRGRADIELHGRNRDVTWRKLVMPAGPGPVRISTPTSAPLGWNIGDELVVASTDFDPLQGERRTISAAPFQPAPLALPRVWEVPVAALTYPHHASGPFAAEVGLLTHNIKIYTPDTDLGVVASWPVCDGGIDDALECSTCATAHADLMFDGAEIRFERDEDARAPSFHIEQVEIFNAGKFGQLGHYPLHLHELGSVPGSYVRRTSIHDSANRGLALHAVQDVAVTGVVTADVIGHAFYLEPDAVEEDEPVVYATRHNTLTGNLAVGTFGCGPLEAPVVGEADEPGARFFGARAAGFYFDDPRNVFSGNAAAGYDFAGFYHGMTDAMNDVENPQIDLDCYHLCASAPIDYASTGSVPLDTSAQLYTSATYDAAAYQVRLPPTTNRPDVCAAMVETECHGAFLGNVAHSGLWGVWAEEHKTTLQRLIGLVVYKNEQRGLGTKNKGFTEVLGLRAADNGTAFWPATHAYHLGLRPEVLVLDAEITGLSDNGGSLASPRGSTQAESDAGRTLPMGGAVPVLGIEVYEGHQHVARSHFEGFDPLLVDVPIAAFGRHQSFPFYSNDPHNSVQEVTFDAASVPVWFDLPDEGIGASQPPGAEDQASGFQTVLLLDLDGSLGAGAGVSVAPQHDFILPGAQCDGGVVACDPDVDASRLPDWNAFVVAAEVPYGQLLINWCDTAQLCRHRGAPSISATPWSQQINDVMTVDGLEIRDLTECAPTGACTHLMQAKHSSDGVHSQLGGNVVLDRDYAVTLWADRAPPVTPLVDVSDLTAIEVMLRGAPAGPITCVSVPVAGRPLQVLFTRGELDGEYQPDTATEVATPTLAGDWAYTAAVLDAYGAVVTPAQVTGCLDAALDRQLATLTVVVQPDP